MMTNTNTAAAARNNAHRDLDSGMVACSHCCTLHRRVGAGPDGVSGCALPLTVEAPAPLTDPDAVVLYF